MAFGGNSAASKLLLIASLMGLSHAWARDDFAHPILDLTPHGLRVDFVRDLDHSNRYRAVLSTREAFALRVRSDRAAYVKFWDWVSADFRDPIALVAVPRGVNFLHRMWQLPEGVRYLQRVEGTELVPFVVRLGDDPAERLLIVKPGDSMPLFSPNLDAETTRDLIASMERGDQVATTLERLVTENARYGVARPDDGKRIEEHYFRSSSAAYTAREAHRARLRGDIERWRERVIQETLSNAELLKLVSFLDENYPLNFEFLAPADKTGFSVRYALDFDLMNAMSAENFAAYVSVAGPRLTRLIAELDVLEHRALSSRLAKTIFTVSDTESELFKEALRFWGKKFEQGSVDEVDFYTVMASLVKSSDPRVGEEVGAILVAHEMALQPEFVDEFYRSFVIATPASTTPPGRRWKISELMIDRLVEYAQFDGEDTTLDEFLRTLLRSQDPRVQEALRGVHGDYQRAVEALQKPTELDAAQIGSHKKCLTIFLNLRKRLSF
ncbi:MAG TPA: hypothetical protein VM901_13510 [Bdellovibrionota bacterium]|jgi:hypothetical protein|nr:hypothetical protein [Bdellovibrionota bacterium]